MPTAINPNNYNIKFFQSYSFGEITDSNYLSYLFNQNLPEISPGLENSPAGNFINTYEERGLEKEINYTSISDSGSIDEWLVNGNYPVNLFDISYQNKSQNVGTNQYGPDSLKAFNYENPILIAEDTGFIQYPTSVGGGVVTNLLSQGLNAVGISATNFIRFDSPLNTVAKERRAEEAKQRLKDGIIENTVGRINLDPLGLLTGQPLFFRDYKITKPAGGFLGDVINFASDVAGVNTLSLTGLFGGPLPDGAFRFNTFSEPFSVDTIDIPEVLLNRTGTGTKSVLFKSLKTNKYGPIIEGQDQPISSQPQAEDSDQPSQKINYLGFSETNNDEETESSDRSGLGRFIDKIRNIGKRDEESLKPTEASDPTSNNDPTFDLRRRGFNFEPYGIEHDESYDSLKASWDYGNQIGWKNQFATPSQITPRNPELSPGTEEGNDGPEPGPQVWDGELFWKDGRTNGLPKRGLLNYTQKLINKSTNVSGAAARFIGLVNSDQNYDTDSGDRRHTEMSQGSLVKETKENKYYCRSWSVRNAYNKYNDLIRYDALWRDSQPGTIKKDGTGSNNRSLGSYSTLRESGTPKIAWERDSFIEEKIKTLGKVNIGREHIIPYMFSIENLAWKDAPQRRKLPLCEQGPHGGRIMWFPPYNINFTDNTSVNWDSTTFIGRAEPIYTYNTTERTGTLSFTIIVDHPSVINKLKEGAFSTTTLNEDGEEVTVPGNDNLEAFFAGCNTEEVKTIVERAFNEVIPPDDEFLNKLEDFEEPEPSFFDKENPPEINEVLSFHFKNATSASVTESGEESGKYANPNIIGNSSCPDGIVGRCFDYNYETELVDWYDNPRLYKGGSNVYGSNGECPEGGVVINDFNLSELVVIPAGGTSARPITPPCNGLAQQNFQPYGPSSSIVTQIEGGNESQKSFLWANNGGYDGENYCCDIGLTAFISGSTTFTNFSEIGFYEFRDGANQRFWGTGSYPFSSRSDGAPPVLSLPFTPEGGWSFSVTGDVPNSIGGAGTGISQLVEFLATTAMGKEYTIYVEGHSNNLGTSDYNQEVAQDRANNVYEWLKDQLGKAEDELGVPQIDIEGFEPIDLFSDKETDLNSDCGRWRVFGVGNSQAESVGIPGDSISKGEFTLTPSAAHPNDYQNEGQLEFRRVDIYLVPNLGCVKEAYDKVEELVDERKELVENRKQALQNLAEKERQRAIELTKSFVNECDYFEAIKKEDSFLYESIAGKLKNFHPAFHSITPEGFNERINFLQQCTRQGPSLIDPEQPQNTAFGRPPVCILRLGDFYFTKIIIDSLNFTFDPLQWDLNPEGIGVQPMLVNVDLNFKFIGGSSLQGPLSQLQNAVSYNFFANTAIYKPLEKILASRGDAGQLITEGDSGFSDKGKKEYYYGPWASPGDFDVAMGIVEAEEENPTQSIESVESVEESIASDFIEEVAPQPIECPAGTTAIKISEEEFETGQRFASFAQEYPPSQYDCWACQQTFGEVDFDELTNLTFIPKEESNPLNTTPGEDNTQTEEQQEQTSPNTTSDEGNNIFDVSNTYSNNSNLGQINISGSAFKGISNGEGNKKVFMISNPIPQEKSFINGLIPGYVYGMLNVDHQDDYTFTITEEDATNLVGGAITNSNIGIIYDGNVSNSNVPVQETSKQIVAFNLFKTLTDYEKLSEWTEDSGWEMVVNEITERYEDEMKVNFNVTYRVYADPTQQGKDKGLTNQVVGDIKINGHLTLEGITKLYQDLVLAGAQQSIFL